MNYGRAHRWDQISRHKLSKPFDDRALTLNIKVQTVWPVYFTNPDILNLGDTAAAQRNYREATGITERLAAADSDNHILNDILTDDLAIFYRLLGLVTIESDLAVAEELFHKTLAIVATTRA